MTKGQGIAEELGADSVRVETCQDAFSKSIRKRGEDAANRVVRRALLQARLDRSDLLRRTLSGDALEALAADADADDWYMPRLPGEGDYVEELLLSLRVFLSASNDRALAQARTLRAASPPHHRPGNTSTATSPPPSRRASAMRPPCASAISRAKARPRPVPWRLVE